MPASSAMSCMRAPAIPLVVNTYFAAVRIFSSVVASFFILTVWFNQMVNKYTGGSSGCPNFFSKRFVKVPAAQKEDTCGATSTSFRAKREICGEDACGAKGRCLRLNKNPIQPNSLYNPYSQYQSPQQSIAMDETYPPSPLTPLSPLPLYSSPQPRDAAHAEYHQDAT